MRRCPHLRVEVVSRPVSLRQVVPEVIRTTRKTVSWACIRDATDRDVPTPPKAAAPTHFHADWVVWTNHGIGAVSRPSVGPAAEDPRLALDESNKRQRVRLLHGDRQVKRRGNEVWNKLSLFVVPWLRQFIPLREGRVTSPGKDNTRGAGIPAPPWQDFPDNLEIEVVEIPYVSPAQVSDRRRLDPVDKPDD